jgi:hypothetical protein
MLSITYALCSVQTTILEAHESTSLEVCLITLFGWCDQTALAPPACCLPDLYNPWYSVISS